jgi:hypothetical protein
MPTPAIIVATREQGVIDYLLTACGDLNALRPAKQTAYDTAVASGVQANIDATYRDLELLDQAIYECGRARAHEGLLL